jgi:zinc transport system substrate-binding protein
MIYRLAPILAVAAGPVIAAPAVVTDIAPTHSIVARVMAGVGEPALLLPPAASPHGYALRPSEAGLLDEAEIVFWIGPALTPWLAGPLEAIAGDAAHVALADAPGVERLPVRASGPFEAHAHANDEHAHEGHADPDHGHDEQHAHDDHEEHAHDDHDHGHDDSHDHEVSHDHDNAQAPAAEATDAHLWLDPLNAVAMATAAAAALAEADPENADAYRANAEAFAGEIDALIDEIAAETDALEARGFIVFHDAYQYFERRFGIPAAGSIALHDAEQPSPARMAEIRERIRGAGIACVFAEPQFDTRLSATAIEGSDARQGTLDPLGTALEPGSAFYPALLRGLVSDLAACLEG